MKIATSYFYQVRNFKKNMIPVSTALGDPIWFHDFTKDKFYIFKDKRGILNGIRLEAVIRQGRAVAHTDACCPCKSKDYQHCKFLPTYEKMLDNIDFDKMITDMENFAKIYQKEENIEDEIIFVLLVHEAPDNKCSERIALQNYFTKHGYECKELNYPI